MSTPTLETSTIIENLRNLFSEGGRTSDWLEVTQALIDKFSDATLDDDWMHIDPERARREGPFDGTIAFGFWTLSMLSHLATQLGVGQYPDGVEYGLNYGFDRVRLLTPVPVGSRIRLHSNLLTIDDQGNGRILVKSENTIEIEGVDKPAMVAEWVILYFVAQ